MMNGIAAAPGVGAGRVALLQRREIPCDGTRIPGKNEGERFLSGRARAIEYYEKLIDRVRATLGTEEAEIFEGHLEILTGDDLEEAVQDTIATGAHTAEQAVLAFAGDTAREFEELDSEYFRQRAGDIRDIGDRLAEAIYYGAIADATTLEPESVVVAAELTPSETARLDTNNVVAIATEKGGRTSHAAILARALGIPCVTGLEGLTETVRAGRWVLVDGDQGTVDTDIDPDHDREKLAALIKRRDRERALQDRRRRWSRETLAQTADGEEVRLEANVSGRAEAELARDLGARGSGLVRSEFFFMQYSDYPSAEKQAAEYRAICRAFAPDPVTVRLLDCGADKPLPYARQKTEDNPFLGERGIRFLMNRPEQLTTQVEAIARVAAEGHAIKLMIPMVVSTEEIRAIRALPVKLPPVGIMVETPASVLAISSFVREVDFVSIGTNDLVQYVMAVDRGNARVAHLYEELSPAVITAISQVVKASHAEGIPVGVCGDMASRPDTALALLALGVDELSSSISAIPEIKAALATITRTELDNLGTALRDAPDAEAARSAIQPILAAVREQPVPWE